MHCGTCKYLGWTGLVKWCRHPAHVRPITKWGKRCPEYVEHDAKIMPGHSAPWPDPVFLTEERS